MAKILRTESSLGRRQTAIDRELRRRNHIRLVVAVLLAVGIGFGVWKAWTSGNPYMLLLPLALIIMGIGYELHLKEIATEKRNLEGGRHGEHKMAALLAERLADDHVILNDLELRIGHERAQIDHLVLSPAGIFIIESKYWAGTLQGDVHAAQWRQVRRHGLPRHIKNPVLQCERQRRMFISRFRTRLPDERIYALAVFTHPAVQLQITGGAGHVFLTSEAIKFINDRCFDPPVLSEADIMALAQEVDRSQV